MTNANDNDKSTEKSKYKYVKKLQESSLSDFPHS